MLIVMRELRSERSGGVILALATLSLGCGCWTMDWKSIAIMRMSCAWERRMGPKWSDDVGGVERECVLNGVGWVYGRGFVLMSGTKTVYGSILGVKSRLLSNRARSAQSCVVEGLAVSEKSCGTN
jgi:hypothetical protein